ncbi:MAG: DegV family protein [Dehalococcoidia bacterium]|nr:DegV family protein [Dehalococcoidia bacterium]
MVHKRKVAVVVDSSSCLPRELLDKWDIYVVPHELIIQDRSFRDGIDINPAEFYQHYLNKDHEIPTTSSPKPVSFLEVFKSAFAVADGVVCIVLSANFSSTCQSAIIATRMAEKDMPGCRINVIDSGAAAGAEGLIALEAAKVAQCGAGLEEVVARIEELIPHVNLLALLDTLYYLRRSGRVPRMAAWAGAILGIRPLTELKLGEARVLDKPRSHAKGVERLVGVMKDRVQQRPAHVNVMHAHAADSAMKLYHRVETEFNCREIFISEFTPVMGAHLGPGLLGLAFYADE